MVFYINANKSKTDKKKPFNVTVSTVGLAKGSHKLRARVRLSIRKPGRKRRRTKRTSTSATFRVC